MFPKDKDTTSLLADYSMMVADIHSHLIPGIDDGSPDLDTTLQMLRELEAIGLKKIYTSPHVVSDSYNNSTDTILAGCELVQNAILREKINLEFYAIAEYYLDETLTEKIKRKDLLTFGKNYVLVELSYQQKQNIANELFYQLQVAGYRVVLAHPERYPYYYENNFDSYHSLKDRSIYFQINIASLTGRYGRDARYTAERMIDEKMVDFVGTDLHRLNQIPVLHEALRSKYMSRILSYDKLLNKTL
ncbi:MAG: hypothetical protein NZM35_03535 [Chitinophagales bacterium]|nr:hypothetical protein [Chitinophagales bacterium]